jgi:hypothetical protein
MKRPPENRQAPHVSRRRDRRLFNVPSAIEPEAAKPQEARPSARPVSPAGR